MGPMAEDFHTTFGLGASDKHITNLDTSGVALASIQALHSQQEDFNSQLLANDQQIESLKQELNSQHKELSKEVADLKKMVQALVAKDRVAALSASQ